MDTEKLFEMTIFSSTLIRLIACENFSALYYVLSYNKFRDSSSYEFHMVKTLPNVVKHLEISTQPLSNIGSDAGVLLSGSGGVAVILVSDIGDTDDNLLPCTGGTAGNLLSDVGGIMAILLSGICGI
jgi:hypothetical protein